jgi:hypothetical protein
VWKSDTYTCHNHCFKGWKTLKICVRKKVRAVYYKDTSFLRKGFPGNKASRELESRKGSQPVRSLWWCLQWFHNSSSLLLSASAPSFLNASFLSFPARGPTWPSQPNSPWHFCSSICRFISRSQSLPPPTLTGPALMCKEVSKVGNSGGNFWGSSQSIDSITLASSDLGKKGVCCWM